MGDAGGGCGAGDDGGGDDKATRDDDDSICDGGGVVGSNCYCGSNCGCLRKKQMKGKSFVTSGTEKYIFWSNSKYFLY